MWLIQIKFRIPSYKQQGQVIGYAEEYVSDETEIL
jgi:hypothetical protein